MSTFTRLVTRDKDDKDDKGFTLIELLVVIIIIGILAAIAIPMFLNQKRRGYDASLKSDLRNAANAMETYYTETDSYPVGLNSTVWSGNSVMLNGEPVKLSGNNALTLHFNATGDAYCLVGTNPKASRPAGFFYISSLGGIQPTGTITCGTY
jgi:prepilin-type N-terminal cleavage/methylation domain-containing protein